MKHEMDSQLKKYLNSFFGSQVKIQKYTFPCNIPLYLDDEYWFKMVSIQETSFITMEPITKKYRLPTLVNHLSKASQLSSLPCVLIFSSLRSSQRSSLIQQKIPFLVPEAQLYLPFMGCAFTEKKTNTLRLPETMAPSTQLVFLYFYYNTSMLPVIASDVAKQLHLSRATLTRAVLALEQLGLISVTEEGTKKLLTLANDVKTDLLHAAKPYMQSPVHQTIYLSEKPKKGLLGGILALSELTMLSATKRDGCYVVSRNQAKELESNKISKQDFLDFGGFPVEVWKYDPALLSNNTLVDTISLIVSFDKKLDERTEQALESVKERVS